MAEFAQISACLVSLVHLSRRVERTRDNPNLWSLLRQKTVDCLQSLLGDGITDGNRLILDMIMNGCTFDELETTLPYFPDEDDQEYLGTADKFTDDAYIEFRQNNHEEWFTAHILSWNRQSYNFVTSLFQNSNLLNCSVVGDRAELTRFIDVWKSTAVHTNGDQNSNRPNARASNVDVIYRIRYGKNSLNDILLRQGITQSVANSKKVIRVLTLVPCHWCVCSG